jgi:hypothetical protein
LKLVPDCLTCHTKAAASTRVTDNLLPEPSACVKCHKQVAISNPPAVRINRFSHQLHLKLGNIAPVIAAAIDKGAYLQPAEDIRLHLDTKNPCEACHRGMEESDAPTRSLLPQMADCLVCHNQIDPPASCGFCHAADAKLTPANHTPDWVDRHSSGKANFDKASCAVCHGKHFTCEGCH